MHEDWKELLHMIRLSAVTNTLLAFDASCFRTTIPPKRLLLLTGWFKLPIRWYNCDPKRFLTFLKIEVSEQNGESIVWLQYGPHIVEVVHPSTLILALNLYAWPRLIWKIEFFISQLKAGSIIIYHDITLLKRKNKLPKCANGRMTYHLWLCTFRSKAVEETKVQNSRRYLYR